MQAVILAAGSGTRLGDHEGGTPKCLLEIGGRPLIEHQLIALAEVGISSVVITVGYQRDRVRAAVRDVVGDAARFVVNDRYAETNSLYSFVLASESIRAGDGDGMLILNSDVLFHPNVLAMVRLAGPNALAYDSHSGNEAEHMKVALADGWLVGMSKLLPVSRSDGENLGVLRLGREAAQDALAVGAGLVAQGRERDWLASAINQTSQRHRFECVDVAGLPWVEIDFLEDLDRARHEVWPTIWASLPAEAASRRAPTPAGSLWIHPSRMGALGASEWVHEEAAGSAGRRGSAIPAA